MMKNFVLVLLAAALLVAISSLFIVDERQLAIKFQLGEIVESDYEPGLHVKAPWPINNVRKFDKRVLTLDTRPERFLTGEKKNVEVDFFVKWRIKDPAKYYTSFMGDERQAGLRLLQIGIQFDQLNVSELAIFELICRKAQMIEYKYRGRYLHRMGAAGDDLAEDEHIYHGTSETRGLMMISPALSSYVAAELHKDAIVLKERRKVREERSTARRGGAGGRAGGGGAGVLLSRGLGLPVLLGGA